MNITSCDFYNFSLERNISNFSFIFILSVNFENLTIRLQILIIYFLFAKFQEEQRSIVISSEFSIGGLGSLLSLR